jgi:hypothetical protein
MSARAQRGDKLDAERVHDWFGSRAGACWVAAIVATALLWGNCALAGEPKVILPRGWFGVFSTGLDSLAGELKAKGIKAEVSRAFVLGLADCERHSMPLVLWSKRHPGAISRKTSYFLTVHRRRMMTELDRKTQDAFGHMIDGSIVARYDSELERFDDERHGGFCNSPLDTDRVIELLVELWGGLLAPETINDAFDRLMAEQDNWPRGDCDEDDEERQFSELEYDPI